MITKEEVLNILENDFQATRFIVNLSSFKVHIGINNKTISFWEDDWVNKNDIILSILNSVLGINKRVFARKCVAKKIDKKVTQKFLNENHLLGSKTAYHKYALYYGNEIVAIATFSKGRKMNRLEANKRSFELINFCSKKGISVVGGLSKLLNNFINELHPGDIMTYIDKDWSDGKSYLNLGFKIHSETLPQSYIFDKKNSTKYHSEKLPENILLQLETNKSNFEVLKNTGNLKLVYTL